MSTNRPDIDRLTELARRDDWHTQLVGSDIRQVLAHINALEAAGRRLLAVLDSHEDARDDEGEFAYHWGCEDDVFSAKIALRDALADRSTP